ncbi:uncharacterized protein [Triticum aestivum]|uniref:uncharacterized protein n=1 Tax=Triticum aestivum TaxID=4565 RepID=UPI001D01835F|nr:uncharacterized protein LOC123106791 [Triticum aestivum]
MVGSVRRSSKQCILDSMGSTWSLFTLPLLWLYLYLTYQELVGGVLSPSRSTTLLIQLGTSKLKWDIIDWTSDGHAMHGNLEQLIPIARHELCSREYQQELNAGCSQIGSIPDGVELELPGDGSDPVPLRVYFFWSLAWCGFVHAYEQAALHAIRFL